MYETINEKVDVIAIFGDGFRDVKPFKVRWRSSEYMVDKIGYKHKHKEGDTIWHIFSCTDGANFFELKFDPQELAWFIGRIWDGEAT